MSTKYFQGIDAKGIENSYSIEDLTKETAIIYFYPKDNTSGCTKEACDFRDNMNRLTAFATVVGISPDSLSHKTFREKQGLNFILLSDPDHILAEEFDVWKEKSMYGRKYMGIERSTFILKNNKIVKEWRKVKVNGHVDEIISYFS